MSTTQSGADVGTGLAERLKAASWSLHEDAEGSPFLRSLFDGTVERDRYAELVAQQWFAYEVLERAAVAMADDPIAAPFAAMTEVVRIPSLEADLAFLIGDDWRNKVSATDATRAYCDRLADVCFAWSGGYVAHHYVRYLGDLSGGQMIGRVVERTYQLDQQGSRFYHFDEIDDAKAWKDRYRGLLDDAAWSEDDKQRLVDEVLLAYQHNTRVLDSLA